MNQSLIAVRYAKAIFAVSQEKKLEDTLRDDMMYLYQACNLVPAFSLLLHSPVVKPSQKLSIVKELFAKDLNPLTINFLTMLISNRREMCLSDMTRNYLDIYKKAKGITSVIMTSATELNIDLENKIVNMISQKFKTKVELTKKIDEDLIGGFVLRIDDFQLDTSVASSLNKLKHTLNDAAYLKKFEI